MKTTPLLFRPEMMRALIAGEKTQTRRPIKPQPPSWIGAYNESDGDQHFFCEFNRDDDAMRHWPGYHDGLKCPYGKPGDLIWCRETFLRSTLSDEAGALYYRAESDEYINAHRADYPNWRPSIFMKREESRLTLQLTAVRAERVKDITEEDAAAEGMGTDGDEAAVISYSNLWDRINGKGSWDKNPWVWVLTFKVHPWNIDIVTSFGKDLLKS